MTIADELTLFGDETPEYSEPLEGIEDLHDLSPRGVHQAVVSATDWTTETIIGQINKGNIQLNPAFQRRDAWRADRKSRFIESLILGFPVPQLVLAESKERKGSYIVIDGKQRLLSVRQFAAEVDDAVYNVLKLTGLSIRSDLNRKTFVDLRANPEFYGDVNAFENQPIRTVVIKNWPNEDFLYQVFLRLNTGSVPLSPQELRQALHPGPFVTFADERSGESDALRDLLNLKQPDFRMRDAELFIRYYAFTLFLPEYNGELKDFLDYTCARLNAEWPERSEQILAHAEDLERAYGLACRVFTPRNVFRKWTSNGYERALNRAIFDVVMYHFSNPAAQETIAANADAVEAVFRELCEQDGDFLAAIERTTKSLEATQTRLATWARALNDRIGTQLHVPELVGNRII